MKCPVCNKELVYDKEDHLFKCESFRCDGQVCFREKFCNFNSDYIMYLDDNRIYGDTYIGVSIKNKQIIIQTEKPGPFGGQTPFVYGPVLVNDVDIHILSYNELSFEFNDPYFPGFIARGSNRDTTFFLFRLINSLKE